jgi:hypothetical protein
VTAATKLEKIKNVSVTLIDNKEHFEVTPRTIFSFFFPIDTQQLFSVRLLIQALPTIFDASTAIT